MGNQLTGRRHINTIDIGITHRGRCGGEVHLSGTRIPRHLHNFLAGSAPDDGVVHQHHILAPELQINRVQLLAHGFLAHFLAGHDEGTADIAVLDEPLPELDPQAVRHLQGGRPAGIRNRHDHVNVVIRMIPQHFLCEGFPHPQPGLVDRHLVDD